MRHYRTSSRCTVSVWWSTSLPLLLLHVLMSEGNKNKFGCVDPKGLLKGGSPPPTCVIMTHAHPNISTCTNPDDTDDFPFLLSAKFISDTNQGGNNSTATELEEVTDAVVAVANPAPSKQDTGYGEEITEDKKKRKRRSLKEGEAPEGGKGRWIRVSLEYAETEEEGAETEGERGEKVGVEGLILAAENSHKPLNKVGTFSPLEEGGGEGVNWWCCNLKEAKNRNMLSVEKAAEKETLHLKDLSFRWSPESFSGKVVFIATILSGGVCYKGVRSIELQV